MILFFQLIIGHALCDYPLQGDFIGKFKSHKIASPVPGVNIWWHLLTAHSLIHAGAVWIVTGSAMFAVLELLAHWSIDFMKSHGITNFHQDQLLHVACKVGYAAALL
jgi:hypothetical protein